MRKIFSALVRYNANSRDAHVGDCVKRAISLALDMSYEEVGHELRKIQKARGSDAWNRPSIYGTLIREHTGSSSVPIPKDVRVDLATWTEQHPSGTYLVEVGNPHKNYVDHLVAVIDGDIYDSWDSTKDIVYRYYVVSESQSKFDSSDIEAIWDQIEPEIRAYADKLSTKFQYAFVHIGNIRFEDDYTISYYGRIEFHDVTLPQGGLFQFGKSYFRDVLSKKFIIKLSPRGVDDAKLATIIKLAKQKLYDWVYNYHKAVADYQASLKIDVNPEFRGDRTDLMKCPEWARPHITMFEDNGSQGWTDRYVIYMDALPDDPRYHTDPEVSFRADTLKELKWQFESYKNHYHRFGYEY